MRVHPTLLTLAIATAQQPYSEYLVSLTGVETPIEWPGVLECSEDSWNCSEGEAAPPPFEDRRQVLRDHEPRCTRLNDTAAQGGDFAVHVGGEGDVAACCALCDAEDLCAAFTLRGTACHIKVSLMPTLPEAGAITGVVELCQVVEGHNLRSAKPCHGRYHIDKEPVS